MEGWRVTGILTFPRVSWSFCWPSGTRVTPQISGRSACLHHSELGSYCWTCCHQLLQKHIKKTTDGGSHSSDLFCWNAYRHRVVLHVSARAVVIKSGKQIGSANTLKAQINTRFELDDLGSDAQRREGGVPVEALSEGWVELGGWMWSSRPERGCVCRVYPIIQLLSWKPLQLQLWSKLKHVSAQRVCSKREIWLCWWGSTSLTTAPQEEGPLSLHQASAFNNSLWSLS